MKKISCAERKIRSAQDLYKKRAAAGFNPAAAFMRSRLSEINQRLTAGSTGGIVSSSAGTSGMPGIVHAAIGTDLVCACSVACDVGVSDGCNCAELHGDLNADIPADGEYALAVFDAVAGIFPAVTVGLVQHFVIVVPAFAKGVTVTGTQTDES